MRKIVAEYAKAVAGPVLLPFGGNFTMGAALRSGGYKGPLLACDITIYSCALGAYLSDRHLGAAEREDCPEHLKGLLDPSDPAHLAASLSLLQDLNLVWKSKNVWHRRVLANARRSWPKLMEKTLTKLAAYKQHLNSGEGFHFFAQDGQEFLQQQDRSGSVFTYPPTYGTKGYLQLDAVLAACMKWEQPKFSEINFDEPPIFELLTSFRQWFIVVEKIPPELEGVLGQPVAASHRGRSSVCFACASRSEKKFVTRSYEPSSSPGPIFPSDRAITGEETPGIMLLNYRQSGRLSELFLSSRVDYTLSGVLLSVAFCLDSLIIGKVDFTKTRGLLEWTLPEKGAAIYQRCDLAVPSVAEPRLSKLVLMLIQSHELKFMLDRRIQEDWRFAVTTAFSKHPVSMKYRGIYKLHSRLEGVEGAKYRLNYYGELGKWSMAEALSIWMKKFHNSAK